MKDTRLNTIKENIYPGGVIDIGTDHGYLLLSLLEEGRNKLLGVEKNKGPYENFKTNVNKKIPGILSDGLKNLEREKVFEYQNIVIAGMGGDLIKTIIDDSIDKCKQSYLILQPNNNEYVLRKYLNDNKFKILKEDIIEENKKIYEIIVCKYKQNYNEKLSEEELFFGHSSKYNKKEFIDKWLEEEKYLEALVVELETKNIKVNDKIGEELSKIKQMRRNHEIGKNH